MKGLSLPVPTLDPYAVVLAQELHDTFERRALDQYGYPPHLWHTLGDDERRLRAEAVHELIEAGRILLMPDCAHPDSLQRLVRREMRICDGCGLPVSLLKNAVRRTT